MSLLGLDVGTTRCKAIVINLDGKPLGYAYREYPLISPRPAWLESDANVLWQSTCDVLREVSTVGKADPIQAMSVSAGGDDVIPVDEHGTPICRSPLSMDIRGTEQRGWWEENIGEDRIYQITGVPFHAMHSINRIMWFRINMPEVFRRAKKFLCWEDFILSKLGCKPVIDFSTASRTMAFDIHQKRWSKEILSKVGIDVDLLAEVRASGEAIGAIDPHVANELGLPPRTLLVVGGIDQACAALGAGSVKPGVAVVGTGTVECLTVACREPKLTKVMLNSGYSFDCHVVEDLFIALADNFGGGSLLRWYTDNFGAQERDLAGRTGRDVYDIIVNAAKGAPSSVFILPHFSGAQAPWNDPYSKGAILGLTLTTTKHDLVRGILDGITYELKQNIERLEEAGVAIQEIRATGGGAKSTKWLQIKANVTGKKVISFKIAEAGCLGAAILAGIGIGAYKSVDEAVKQVVKLKEVFHPNPAEYEIYQEKYKVYSRIYPTIAQLSHEMEEESNKGKEQGT